MLQLHLPHPSAPAWVRDQLAIALTALLSMAVLWFGSAGAQQLATHGIVGATRTHTAMGSLSGASERADYGMTFDYVVAPMSADFGASMKTIRFAMEDFLPLPWGKGYL
jgi:hypothetical protein